MVTYMIPCLLGLEKLVADEVKRLGLQDVQAENGRILCRGTAADCARLNINLRCGARVMMVLGQFPARSFEELFQGVRAIPWEDYLPRDAAFPVKGYAISSQLHAVSACQSIIKKAMVERMKAAYGLEQFPETGVKYQIRFSIFKDEAAICLDTSGEGLYKRGYRAVGVEAPLRETLAAALLDVSPWRTRMPLYDPCCGTGTILIEAAIKAAARPAGIDRSFVCEEFPFMKDVPMAAIRLAEREKIPAERSFSITGSDIDPEALELCRRHIHQAGFDGQISVRQQDLRTLQVPGEPGVFLCNPPYGERLGDKREAEALYREMGLLLKRHPGWKLCAITSDFAFERCFGRRATHKRRLYNGRLECEFYIFE